MNRSGSQLLANIRKDRQDRLKKKSKEITSPNGKKAESPSDTISRKVVKFHESTKPAKKKIESFHLLKSSAVIRSALKGMAADEPQNSSISNSATPNVLPLSPSCDRVLSVGPRRLRNPSGDGGYVKTIPSSAQKRAIVAPSLFSRQSRELAYAPSILNDVRLDVDGYVIPPPPPAAEGVVGADMRHAVDDVESTASELSWKAHTRLREMTLREQVPPPPPPLTEEIPAVLSPHIVQAPSLVRVNSHVSLASMTSTLTATTSRSYMNNSASGFSYGNGNGNGRTVTGNTDATDNMSCFSATISEASATSASRSDTGGTGRASPSPFKYKILTSPLNAQSINSTVKVPKAVDKRGTVSSGTSATSGATSRPVNATETGSLSVSISIAGVVKSVMSSAQTSTISTTAGSELKDCDAGGSCLFRPPRYATGTSAESLQSMSSPVGAKPRRPPPKIPS